MHHCFRQVLVAAAVVVGSLTTATQAAAVPILNPGNGHWYDFIPGSVTWGAAVAAAGGMVFDPPGPVGPTPGHLVTITSAAENAFLNANYPAGYWIAATDAATEGIWMWAAGPEAGTVFWIGGPAPGGAPAPGQYANWNGGEPNNLGNEDFATENLFGVNWNDWCAACTTNFVVEFSTAPVVVPVPEPASLTLLALGLAGFAYGFRRRSR